MTIRNIPSTSNPEGISLLGVLNHPNWLTFARDPCLSNDSLRVISYINIHLFSLRFSLQKDIINYRDILLASFFNNNSIFWIMNIYSDSSHTILKYLKDAEVNILNLLIMTGNFNIRDSIWNSSFPHHSSFSDNLMIIVDSFNLKLLFPTNHVPTRYLDSDMRSNSVINLIFLQSGSIEINTYFIYLDLCLLSDHALLSVMIAIKEEKLICLSLLLQKTARKRKTLLKTSQLLLRTLIYQIYLIIAKLRKLQTCLHQELNLYGKWMLNEFKLWNILKAGRITIAIMLWTSIRQQEI